MCECGSECEHCGAATIHPSNIAFYLKYFSAGNGRGTFTPSLSDGGSVGMVCGAEAGCQRRWATGGFLTVELNSCSFA